MPSGARDASAPSPTPSLLTETQMTDPKPDSLASALAVLQTQMPRIGKDRKAQVKGQSKNGLDFNYTYAYARRIPILHTVGWDSEFGSQRAAIARRYHILVECTSAICRWNAYAYAYADSISIADSDSR